ncbi:hypothetical protein [Isobaculum melis]|uniref:Uncharacterized protein n=1 Tax=Isobaculum melis TaxID=142588 RepID=A0A1H9PMN4_9LACT|nr:hypothetical protein [Isobaculum melis]SER49521.1 hypothetical protein SAMN04488559_10125 [Isobaculum melis]
MSIKRFVQLFICYALSVVVSLFIVDLFKIKGFWLVSLVISVIGFIVICIPLTILTVLKNKK